MIEDVRGLFFGPQACARRCEGPGRIVFISSPAAVRAVAGATLETVGGAFLTTAAQAAAVELARRGITANVVVPALEPDERTVDAVVDFLTSDAAQGITGAVIAADGGFALRKSAGGSPLLDSGGGGA